jgi:hypothetical protein
VVKVDDRKDGATMAHFQLFAQPLWVNLLALIPLALFFGWRRRRIQICRRQFLFATAFALAFGFVEAAVVVYFRAAADVSPGYKEALSEIQLVAEGTQSESSTITPFPRSLLTVEMLREGATIVMLVSIALLATGRTRERWTVFLWTFAVWDISYYVALWATIGWPTSLKDLDILFLIPVPWVAQVWFPLLVSALTLITVGLNRGQADLSSMTES